MASAQAATLLGKLPSQPDFVRLHCNDVAVRFDQWLQQAVELLHAAGWIVPPRAYHFALREPGGEALLVGVLTASQDKVGRRFPVVTFGQLAWSEVGHGIAAAPDAFAAPLRAMHDLAMELPALTLQETDERLRAIPSLQGTLHGTAPGPLQQAFLEADAQAFMVANFGNSLAAWSYALHTFRLAVTSASADVQGKQIVLRCPIRSVADVLSWMCLAESVGPPGQLAGALWDAGSSNSALLCAGGAPPGLLRFACDPAAEAHNLWPLTTTVVAAREHAEAAVGATIIEQVAAGARLPALWHAIGQGPS